MILSLLLLACGVLPGTECNLMFMESGLTVALDGTLDDGVYTFQVMEQGQPPLACGFEISEVPSADLCEGVRVDFDAAGQPTLRVTPDLPEDVEVVLWQDDAELASQVFEGIEYEETEYNGEGCDVAYNAHVTLQLE